MVVNMDSVWSVDCGLPHFKRLTGNINTDVLIIGGGLAGILCAYFLQEQNVDYVLTERKTICSGVTKNTTAKITAQHGLIYHRLMKSEGNEKARMYLDANQEAVRKFAVLCSSIDCDFEEKTAYVYSKNDRRKLEEEAEALERLGISARVTEESRLPFGTAGAVSFPGQAQFHPLKFVSAVAKGLNIYEETFVKELTEIRR